MDYEYETTPDLPFGPMGSETPYSTLLGMLEYVRDEINPDIILWTGDNSCSDTWSNTLEEVVDYVVNITETMDSYLGNTNITIFPVLGNHDTWPVNVEDFRSPGIDKATNEFKQYWQQYLDEDAYDLFGQFGYYSQNLRLRNGSEYANTKIIGLNTQACLKWNWYLMDTRDDPGNQLTWFENELA